jgi:hypothetical protein
MRIDEVTIGGTRAACSLLQFCNAALGIGRHAETWLTASRDWNASAGRIVLDLIRRHLSGGLVMKIIRVALVALVAAAGVASVAGCAKAPAPAVVKG